MLRHSKPCLILNLPAHIVAGLQDGIDEHAELRAVFLYNQETWGLFTGERFWFEFLEYRGCRIDDVSIRFIVFALDSVAHAPVLARTREVALITAVAIS